MIFNQNIIVEGSPTNFSGVTATQQDVINGKSFHNSQGQLVEGTLPQLVNNEQNIEINFSQNDTTGNIDIVFRKNQFVKSGQFINKVIGISPFDRGIIFKYWINITYEYLGSPVEVCIENTVTNETHNINTSNQSQTIVMSGYFDSNIPVKVYVQNSEQIHIIHQRKTIEYTSGIHQDKRVYVITDYYTVSQN